MYSVPTSLAFTYMSLLGHSESPCRITNLIYYMEPLYDMPHSTLFLLKRLVLVLNNVYTWLYVWKYAHERRHPWSQQEGVRCPRVISSFELFGVGTLTGLGSSGRAIFTLNHWTIFLAPFHYFFPKGTVSLPKNLWLTFIFPCVGSRLCIKFHT